MKLKKILISQPAPSDPKSPYFDLAKKNNLDLTFRQLIHIEGLEPREFRKQKIDLLAFTAVIFVSKVAVDHYFRLADEMRVAIPETMKYFCISENVAVYLQKYIVFRKRKIFYSNNGNKVTDMVDTMRKHKDEKYLLPVSEIHKNDVTEAMAKIKIAPTKAVFYRTVSSDVTDLNIKDYDAIIFFSPQGIASLKNNFPDYEQGSQVLGCFGTSTSKAIEEAGLRLDIACPTPECPSITKAIDKFINS